MIYFLKALYSFLLPPGIFILLLLLAAAAFLRFNRKAALFIGGSALLLYALSTPAWADAVMGGLERRYAPPPSIEGDAYVVLGGGSLSGVPSPAGEGQLSGPTLQRVVTAVQLYARKPLPIVFSGGQVYAASGNEGHLAKRMLIELGIPEEQILVDDTSRNTQENARNTQAILTKQRLNEPVLITSAFHMARAVKHFEAQGVDVIPYPTDFRTRLSGPPRAFTQLWTPQAGALENLSVAMKEYLGMLQ
ncbi:YdcF family protein [Paenibacillus puerhi]|uniref:YdcF family protein n=1 Tax=Paenibacillus puerhi TaxID=2692622 RepID=UPI00135A9B00|nr:YdcF family protein [Paenibacillus puerhi]